MAGSPYKFSSDELRVLEQCNRESFYQRCLPLATLFGAGTFFAVKAGHLAPNPRFGAAPKMFGAVTLGYIMGKLSYQSVCAEKFMALPDSKLGAMLRSRKAGYLNTMVMDGSDVESVLKGVPETEKYDDLSRPSSHMDMDLDRPGMTELNDSFRPSVNDSDILHKSKLDDQFQRPSSSYDELRKRNRETYENRSRPFSSILTQDPVSRAPEPPSQSPPPRSDPWFDSQPKKPSNIYGDIFEK